MNENAIQTAVALAVVFLGLFALERALPLRRAARRLWGRVVVNLAVAAIAFLTGLLLVRPTASSVIVWGTQSSFGLLRLLDLPVPAEFVVAFLWMDLSFYYWHVANHRIPLLWRFHNVHHIDPDLDVSTAFRFHFGEVALSAGFRAVQVAVIGLPVWMFLAYEVVFQANTMFHHSNLRLPIRLERALNTVLVTPRMHGIHHSRVPRETNSNYSVVFSWWDRAHGTLCLNILQSRVTIGVAGYAAPEDNRLRSLLAMPFCSQRDYWRTAGGDLPERPAADLQGPRNSLAA
jgi:sterol desaturase/sphingolipid hydroxylase (fatty acid hydroxylase superfamily)